MEGAYEHSDVALEAENNLLGTVMTHRELWPEARLLAEEIFGIDFYRALWRSCLVHIQADILEDELVARVIADVAAHPDFDNYGERHIYEMAMLNRPERLDDDLTLLIVEASRRDINDFLAVGRGIQHLLTGRARQAMAILAPTRH